MFDLMDHLKSKDARRQSLESIQKNHSNFYAGVKAVLQNAQSIQGIIGAVSEHLTFDTRYQTALEIAMGASGQNIIVEDEAAAKRSIDYLKRNRQGRANISCRLTTIKPRQLNGQFVQSLANAPGFIGMASDLVTYEDRLSNIFQNLLGVTAIFDTIDNANKALELFVSKYVWLLLTGLRFVPVVPLLVVPTNKTIISSSSLNWMY